jgi:hypothetical protein
MEPGGDRNNLRCMRPPEAAITTNLPDDLRQAIEKEGSSPVHIVDAATNVHYVLIRAEQYDNLNGSFASDEKFDPRDFSLAKAG